MLQWLSLMRRSSLSTIFIDFEGAELISRMRTAPSSSLVNGTAWSTDQFIKVQPVWLLFPTLLWLGITIILIATILRTERHDTPVWKASQLATVQCLEPYAIPGSLHQIKHNSKDKYLRLEQVEASWQLRAVSVSSSQKHTSYSTASTA
jgi:hypothetical protein